LLLASGSVPILAQEQRAYRSPHKFETWGFVTAQIEKALTDVEATLEAFPRLESGVTPSALASCAASRDALAKLRRVTFMMQISQQCGGGLSAGRLQGLRNRLDQAAVGVGAALLPHALALGQRAAGPVAALQTQSGPTSGTPSDCMSICEELNKCRCKPDPDGTIPPDCTLIPCELVCEEF
jgi:hypothetical protein